MAYAGEFVDFGAIPKDQSYGMGIRDVRGRFRSEGRGRVILCGLLAIMSDRPDAGIDVNVFPFRQVCRECASIGLPADSFQRFLKKSLVRRANQYARLRLRNEEEPSVTLAFLGKDGDSLAGQFNILFRFLLTNAEGLPERAVCREIELQNMRPLVRHHP